MGGQAMEFGLAPPPPAYTPRSAAAQKLLSLLPEVPSILPSSPLAPISHYSPYCHCHHHPGFVPPSPPSIMLANTSSYSSSYSKECFVSSAGSHTMHAVPNVASCYSEGMAMGPSPSHFHHHHYMHAERHFFPHYLPHMPHGPLPMVNTGGCSGPQSEDGDDSSSTIIDEDYGEPTSAPTLENSDTILTADLDLLCEAFDYDSDGGVDDDISLPE